MVSPAGPISLAQPQNEAVAPEGQARARQVLHHESYQLDQPLLGRIRRHRPSNLTAPDRARMSVLAARLSRGAAASEAIVGGSWWL